MSGNSEQPLWILLKLMLPLIKGIFGGLGAFLIMWVIIVAVNMWRSVEISKNQADHRLGAVAGGLPTFLHQPIVLLSLTAAFGVGFYLASRR